VDANVKELKVWTLRQHVRFELISFPFVLLFYEPNSTVVIYISSWWFIHEFTKKVEVTSGSEQRITIVKLPSPGLQAVTEV